MHFFSNLFLLNVLFYVSERSTVHHQESIAVYPAIGICHVIYADCQTEYQNYIEPLLALTYQPTSQKEKFVPKPLLLNKRRQKLKILYIKYTHTQNEEFGKRNIYRISLNFINKDNLYYLYAV